MHEKYSFSSPWLPLAPSSEHVVVRRQQINSIQLAVTFPTVANLQLVVNLNNFPKQRVGLYQRFPSSTASVLRAKIDGTAGIPWSAPGQDIPANRWTGCCLPGFAWSKRKEKDVPEQRTSIEIDCLCHFFLVILPCFCVCAPFHKRFTMKLKVNDCFSLEHAVATLDLSFTKKNFESIFQHLQFCIFSSIRTRTAYTGIG